jgi:hypothetical protein
MDKLLRLATWLCGVYSESRMALLPFFHHVRHVSSWLVRGLWNWSSVLFIVAGI